MPVRRNVLSLSAAERAALVAAFKAMKTRPDPDGVASNVYDKYVLQHSQTMRTPSPPNTDPRVCNAAHRGPAFAPWHREFLRRFEIDLGMTLPYWDWAADQDSGSPMTAAVWGTDLMGPNGDPNASAVVAGAPANAVVQGPFAHDPNDSTSWSTIADPADPQRDTDVPWLTRQFGMGGQQLPSGADVVTTLGVTPYDSPPWNVGSQGFRNTLEGFIGAGMHNAAHMWVGGSMMPASSPNDPVFFLHHANVDRIWANWQRKFYNDPLGAYLPVTGGPTGHNLQDGMSPWGGSSSPQSVLDTFAIGYWYDDAPAPAITSIAPTSGAPGGGTIVVITGSGFMGTTSVTFGATPAVTFNVDSDTQISAVSPAGTGTVTVSVTTPVGTSTSTPADEYTYVAAPAAPQVTSVAPSSGTASGGDSVVITGGAFTGATGVVFGNAAAASFSVDSDTQITAVSPAVAMSGTVDITVTTPAGTSSASTADQFTFTSVPVAITSVAPTAGPASGGTSVVITGSGFTGATAVAFGSTAASSFTVDSDTQITAVSPAAAMSGAVDITVTTPSGTSPTSAADQFTYGAPAVTAINPPSGAPAGGDNVVITGSGFTGATAVQFGATAASSFTVDSDTQITAVTPAVAASTVDVTVTTAAGTSATGAGDQFTFGAAPAQPTITGLNPSSGSTAGGDSVVITGSGFTAATAVAFATTAAASFVVDSDMQITAVSPAATAGTVDVSVTTPAGTSATVASDQFTFAAAAPAITGLNPSTASTAGGDSVVITGTGFTGATSVNFGSDPAASFTVDSDTQITAVTPSVMMAGTVDVTVTTPVGTSAIVSFDEFVFSDIMPLVSGVSPGMGSTGGGDSVVITGSGFTGATSVMFGTDAAASFSVDSDTQITAVSPAAAASTVDITVVGPGGTSATAASDTFMFM